MTRETAFPVLALTFDYGQKASLKEQKAAQRAASLLGVPHRILALPWLQELTTTALVNPNGKIPRPQSKDLDDPEEGRKTAASVWVPNRNGLFLNIAACYAESLKADVLITGFNAEEGVTFPDNSAPFVRAADEFLWYSTQRKVRVLSPTLKLRKTEIAQKALEMNIPLQDLWFCYEGGSSPCRVCESCLRALRAFEEAGVKDFWDVWKSKVSES